MMRKLLLSAVLSLWTGMATAQGVTVQQLPVDPAPISNSTTFWCGDGAPPHTYQCPMPNVWQYGLGLSNTWTLVQNFPNGLSIAGNPAGTAAVQNIGTSGATVPLLSGLNTFGAKQTFFTSITGSASVNIPQGVAPTSPVNGDCWGTSAGLFCYYNGSTQGPYGTSGSGVTTYNTRSGAVTGISADVTSALGYTPLDKAGSVTATGKLTFFTSTTGAASINLPQGAVPTSPVNGDMWATSSGFFGQIAGATVGPFSTGGGGGGVSSFNTRTGAVTLAGSDVTTALGGTPTLAANNGSDFTSVSTVRTNLGVAYGTTAGTVVQGNDARLSGLTQTSVSAARTIAATDCGTELYHPAGDTTARTWTLPANASVPIAVGCKIEVTVEGSAGTITMPITSDTLKWFAATISTGTRTLPAGTKSTLTKETATEWVLVGAGPIS